jgi:hypothetical protein
MRRLLKQDAIGQIIGKGGQDLIREHQKFNFEKMAKKWGTKNLPMRHVTGFSSSNLSQFRHFTGYNRLSAQG